MKVFVFTCSLIVFDFRSVVKLLLHVHPAADAPAIRHQTSREGNSTNKHAAEGLESVFVFDLSYLLVDE